MMFTATESLHNVCTEEVSAPSANDSCTQLVFVNWH